MSADPNELDLQQLAAWRSGDQGAANTLLQRHNKWVRAFLRSHAPPEEIDDLAAKIMLTVVETRDTFRGGSYRAFVATIARFKLKDMYRRRRPDLAEPLSASIRDLGAGLSSMLHREEERQLLTDALSDLELDDAIVLLLYFQERLTGPELALVFEVPEGTIRGRLSAAKRRLREAYQRRIDAGAGPQHGAVDRAEWLRQIQLELGPHLQRLKPFDCE